MNPHYDDAEGHIFEREKYKAPPTGEGDHAHTEPPLDSTSFRYSFIGADGKPRTREVIHALVSGVGERVIVTDKQTFEAEAEAYAKSFAAGMGSARRRIPDAAFRRHFVAALIAVGHNLRLARATGIAPDAEHVADRFVAEIDALERETAEADVGLEQEQAQQAPGRRLRVTFSDFVAYMPSHQYIYKPTREMWLGGASMRACQKSWSAKTKMVRTSR